MAESKTIFKLAFSIILLPCLNIHNVKALNQVTLYSGFNQAGPNLTLIAQAVMEGNLYRYSFNNMARSICITGLWLFYDLDNFNQGAPNGGLEYYFGNNSCVNFVQNAKRISSLRYAGLHGDYKRSGITFYQQKYFQGQSSFVDVDLSTTYNRRNVSFIVTGSSNEGWTFYERPRYQGNSVCVFPPSTCVPYQPAIIYDMDLIGISEFQSLRKGCFAKDTKNIKVEAIPSLRTQEKTFPKMSKPFFGVN